MDLTCGVVVWMTMRAIKNSNPYRYPRGRTRLEPIAIIIVSIVMGIGNMIMIIESVSSIVNNTVSKSFYFLVYRIYFKVVYGFCFIDLSDTPHTASICMFDAA